MTLCDIDCIVHHRRSISKGSRLKMHATQQGQRQRDNEQRKKTMTREGKGNEIRDGERMRVYFEYRNKNNLKVHARLPVHNRKRTE